MNLNPEASKLPSSYIESVQPEDLTLYSEFVSQAWTYDKDWRVIDPPLDTVENNVDTTA